MNLQPVQFNCEFSQSWNLHFIFFGVLGLIFVDTEHDMNDFHWVHNKAKKFRSQEKWEKLSQLRGGGYCNNPNKTLQKELVLGLPGLFTHHYGLKITLCWKYFAFCLLICSTDLRHKSQFWPHRYDNRVSTHKILRLSCVFLLYLGRIGSNPCPPNFNTATSDLLFWQID